MSEIDTNSPLYLKALTIAVRHFLAFYPPEMSPAEVLHALADSPESWPENIDPWEPFEPDSPETVYEYIETLAESIFTEFASNAYINRVNHELEPA